MLMVPRGALGAGVPSEDACEASPAEARGAPPPAAQPMAPHSPSAELFTAARRSAEAVGSGQGAEGNSLAEAAAAAARASPPGTASGPLSPAPWIRH